jgi:outer membrane protein assembly factor BamD
MRSMIRRWLLLVLPLILSACSTTPDKTELTERDSYEQARAALDKESFLLAVEKLQDLESRYPFGRYAEQAELELIYAHYRMSDMEAVLADTERFIRMNPLHEKVDYAYYMRALATYEMGFTLVERRLNSGNSKRDITPLRDAFNYFSDLLTRFPDSPYTADARARMIYLRQRMASHDVEIARYYMKRHAFIAAANRCENVLVHYQRTPAVADALAIMVEAYQELNMTAEADKAMELLAINYPDHPQMKNGEFQSSGLAQVDRHSLLEVMTFGLLR